MIAISLRGGLGNQLFQWALALEFQHRGKRVVLDPRFVSAERGVPIHGVDSSIPHSRLPSLGWHPGRWSPPFGRTATGFRIVEERTFEFWPGIFDAISGRVLLHGYWQSSRYFPSVHCVVRARLFKAADQVLTTRGRALLNEIQNTFSASVHIRRGDYASNPVAAGFHGVLPDSYYHESISRLRGQGFQKFFIFSDDPRESVRWSAYAGCHPVPHCVSLRPLGELLLMASCRAHVLANSSFSWWAGWLDERVSSPVLVPARWFSDSQIVVEDMLLERWHRVEVRG